MASERPMSKIKSMGYTSMAPNPSNSGNLEQLALKGLNWATTNDDRMEVRAAVCIV